MSPRTHPPGEPAAVLAVFALAALLALPATAGAAGDLRCTKAAPASRILYPSFGTEDPDNVEEYPAGVLQGYVTRGRSDAATALRVRLVPGPRGTSVPQLCAGSHRLATLPPLRRGTHLVNLSANGRAIVWRTARSSTRGTISTGRIVGRRVRGIRTTPTAATGRLLQSDHRITVAPNGDAVWALDGARAAAPSRAWAWPHGRPVRALRLTASQRRGFGTVMLIDDQHVVIDDGDPLRFAPATPGACPRRTTDRWRPLQTWRVATFDGFTLGSTATEMRNWTVACDTVSGRLFTLYSGGQYRDQYCGTIDAVTRIASTGRWLAVERRGTEGGSACGESLPTYRSTVLDPRSGRGSAAGGGLAGPGAAAPTLGAPYDTGRFLDPAYVAERGAWPSVVFADGVIAWATRSSADGQPHRFTVTLADAAGTRVVGTATTPNLTLDGTLRWTEDGQPRIQSVAPDATWSPAAVLSDL